MAGERENARERNIRCCIYTTTLHKIDRMALFIPSHLLLYVRGETAENSRTNAKIRRRVHRKIGNFLPSHIDFLFLFSQSIGKWKRKWSTEKNGVSPTHLRK